MSSAVDGNLKFLGVWESRGPWPIIGGSRGLGGSWTDSFVLTFADAGHDEDSDEAQLVDNCLKVFV